MPPPERASKEWVYRLTDAVWGEPNLDAIDELVADEFIEHSSASVHPVNGSEMVRESVRAMLTAVPDSEVRLEDIVAEGNRLAIRAKATATHQGAFMDIDLTGNRIEVTVVAFHRRRTTRTSRSGCAPIHSVCARSSAPSSSRHRNTTDTPTKSREN